MRATRVIVEPITTCAVLKRVYSFDEYAYGDVDDGARSNIPFLLFKEWWTAFPTGFLCAFRNGEPRAVVGFFPVSEAWMRTFLEYRTSERELHAADIEASDRRSWYFSGLSSNARLGRVGPHLPCILGEAILKWLHINASIIGNATITIVAEGATSIGARLLGRLFARAPVPGQDYRPRFAVTTDIVGIRRVLIENPFFSRFQRLRAEASGTLRDL